MTTGPRYTLEEAQAIWRASLTATVPGSRDVEVLCDPMGRLPDVELVDTVPDASITLPERLLLDLLDWPLHLLEGEGEHPGIEVLDRWRQRQETDPPWPISWHKARRAERRARRHTEEGSST